MILCNSVPRIPPAALLLRATAAMAQTDSLGGPLDQARNPARLRQPAHVFRASANSAMRIDRNLLAIEAVRGRSIVAASDSPGRALGVHAAPTSESKL